MLVQAHPGHEVGAPPVPGMQVGPWGAEVLRSIAGIHIPTPHTRGGVSAHVGWCQHLLRCEFL